jgi:hypothetical protein
MLCLSYYLLCFLFNKIGDEDSMGLPGSEVGVGAGGGGGSDAPNNVYTYE